MAAKVDAEEKPNTFDPKRVGKIVGKIEREFEGLLSERMSYMSKCRPYRERIAQAYEEGVGFGIPKGVLKAKIRERDLQRKIDCIADGFEEEDDRESFDQLTQALGGLADMPLGKAAMAAASADHRKQSAVGESTWTDDMVETLRKLAADGLSATAIGERMTLTGKQVSGKAGRLGIKLTGKPGKAADDEDEPDLRSDSQKLAEQGREEEAARVAAENADKLAGGIKPLTH